jgi:DnaJ family protein A protein 2
MRQRKTLKELIKKHVLKAIISNFWKIKIYRHPDKGGDPEKFKMLNEAASILSDPEKK